MLCVMVIIQTRYKGQSTNTETMSLSVIYFHFRYNLHIKLSNNTYFVVLTRWSRTFGD